MNSTALGSEPTCPVLKKCTEDYMENWMPRKEILLNLSIEEISEILKDTRKELELIFSVGWHFNFYMRQLFLKSTSRVSDVAPIKKVLDDTKYLMDFFTQREIRSLWGTLQLQHFLSETSEHSLYEMFSGTRYYDYYLAQIAYEEFKRRKAVSIKKEVVGPEMKAGEGR